MNVTYRTRQHSGKCQHFQLFNLSPAVDVSLSGRQRAAVQHMACGLSHTKHMQAYNINPAAFHSGFTSTGTQR